jgi:hypothetical protein
MALPTPTTHPTPPITVDTTALDALIQQQQQKIDALQADIDRISNKITSTQSTQTDPMPIIQNIYHYHNPVTNNNTTTYTNVVNNFDGIQCV